MGSIAGPEHGRLRRDATDLGAVAGLVAVGYAVVLAAIDQAWMDVAPAFAILTLPAVGFLAWRTPMPWARVLVGTAVFGGMFGFFFEMFQESGDSYRVVAAAFPKLLGVVPVDSVIAHMLMTLLTLTFYEHFVLAGSRERPAGDSVPTRLGRRARAGIALGAAMVLVVVVLHTIEPSWVVLPYSYAILGIAAITPPVALALRRPRWLRRLTVLLPAFLVYYLVMEIVAVRHSWWIYPADRYLGWVTLPGPLDDVRFPFEELFFWMLLYAAALASYYEIFLLPRTSGPGRAPAVPRPDRTFAVREKAGEGTAERDLARG